MNTNKAEQKLPNTIDLLLLERKIDQKESMLRMIRNEIVRVTNNMLDDSVEQMSERPYISPKLMEYINHLTLLRFYYCCLSNDKELKTEKQIIEDTEKIYEESKNRYSYIANSGWSSSVLINTVYHNILSCIDIAYKCIL